MEETKFIPPIIIKEENEGATTVIIKQEAIDLEFETEEEYGVLSEHEPFNAVEGVTEVPRSNNGVNTTTANDPYIPNAATPPIPKKPKPYQKVSGYIMFCAEMRLSVTKENKYASFGYISKIIGELWKRSDIETKDKYYQLAVEYNAKKAIEVERKVKVQVPTPTRKSARVKPLVQPQPNATTPIVATPAKLRSRRYTHYSLVHVYRTMEQAKRDLEKDYVYKSNPPNGNIFYNCKHNKGIVAGYGSKCCLARTYLRLLEGGTVERYQSDYQHQHQLKQKNYEMK